MTEIMGIKDKVQEVAEAINAALGVDTEIVDEKLTIVAGTGRYLQKIGLKEEQGDLGSGYLYSEALRTGKTYIIEKGETHPTYAPEENELAEICHPIIYEGKIVGLMGLVAFDEDQRTILLEKKEGMVLLLKQMSNLLCCKLRETKKSPVVRRIIGESPIAQELSAQVERISSSLSNILITGESGTGKDLLARVIHRSSPMKLGPFVVVNCGAIPENLLESELFGYEAGAFTGAKEGGKIGLFETASNGTIFLDEIGDMPLHLQVKLLHVLQEREIQRVGGTSYIPVNVRVIAATNRDLEKLIEEKLFREDLFFRLSVIPIFISPLRERKEDLDHIIDHVLKNLNIQSKETPKQISTEARKVLLKHNWPGNIRELENVLEYSWTMEEGQNISVDSLPAYLTKKKREKGKIRPLKDQLTEIEKDAIKECLDYTGRSLEGKIKAAELLGISESTLYRRLKVLGIQ